jgi:ubiquinone/menaquinone biosynthesis C-methylase UbiE
MKPDAAIFTPGRAPAAPTVTAQEANSVTPSDDNSQEMLGGFASVDQANSGHFASRLDAMHALDFFRAYKKETFLLMRAQPGSRVADIGCGTGDDAKRLTEVVGTSGHVTAFDLSEALLNEAKTRHAGTPNLDFVVSPADHLDAPDAYFDAVRADRVLTHVPNIAAALREMSRVVKPGGRIVVSEPDMPGSWLSSHNPEISARVLHAIALSCTQPYAARDLYHAFLDAGFEDVELRLHSAAIGDAAPAENIMNFHAALKRMLETGALKPEEAALWGAEFEERRRTGRFLGGITIFVAAGTNPGTAAK